jgi:hypothetical protein
LTALCIDAQLGIEWGARVLHHKIQVTGSLESGILAYNGGGDLTYLPKVLELERKYQKYNA